MAGRRARAALEPVGRPPAYSSASCSACRRVRKSHWQCGCARATESQEGWQSHRGRSSGSEGLRRRQAGRQAGGGPARAVGAAGEGGGGRRPARQARTHETHGSAHGSTGGRQRGAAPPGAARAAARRRCAHQYAQLPCLYPMSRAKWIWSRCNSAAAASVCTGASPHLHPSRAAGGSRQGGGQRRCAAGGRRPGSQGAACAGSGGSSCS